MEKEAEARPTIITIPVKSLDSILQVAVSERFETRENTTRLAFRKKHREEGRLERRETS